MVVGTIKTGVDSLISLLEKQDKIPLAEAAKSLRIPVKILQTWVDFLVEEKIINVEYKFTVPYIYLNRSRAKDKSIHIQITLDAIKKMFFDRATKKKIPRPQIEILWEKKLNTEIENQKEYFFRYGKLKKIDNLEQLWGKFCKKIHIIDNPQVD